MSRGRVRSALGATLLVLLGIVVGLLSAVEHRQHADVAGLAIPWGMALGLGATWVLAAASEETGRRGSSWFTVGWALHLLLASAGSGYLIADDVSGWVYTLLGGGGLLVVVVLASGRRRRGQQRTRSRGAGSAGPT